MAGSRLATRDVITTRGRMRLTASPRGTLAGTSLTAAAPYTSLSSVTTTPPRTPRTSMRTDDISQAGPVWRRYPRSIRLAACLAPWGGGPRSGLDLAVLLCVPVPPRPRGRLGAVADLQLVEDVVDVVLHGGERHQHALGDFFVGQPV